MLRETGKLSAPLHTPFGRTIPIDLLHAGKIYRWQQHACSQIIHRKRDLFDHQAGRTALHSWHYKSPPFVSPMCCSRVLICILIECELRCLSCIILHIVCRMDHTDCVAVLNIKQAQPAVYMWIIHSGNRGPQDHQMNIKPLMKASHWHDTLPWS